MSTMRELARRFDLKALESAAQNSLTFARDYLDIAERLDRRQDYLDERDFKNDDAIAAYGEVQELTRRLYNVQHYVKSNLQINPLMSTLRTHGDELVRLAEGGDPQ